ncbi:hypothetical protein U1Q18_045819 [Sarracenia purpurea var. burkii]
MQREAEIISRDDERSLLAGGTDYLQQSSKADHAEAYGAIKALEMVAALGMRYIHLEGNSLGIIIKAFKSEEDLLNIVTLVNEAKEISMSFQGFICSHVQRNGNIVAHELSRFALIAKHQVWTHDLPPQIMKIARMDKS